MRDQGRSDTSASVLGTDVEVFEVERGAAEDVADVSIGERTDSSPGDGIVLERKALS